VWRADFWSLLSLLLILLGTPLLILPLALRAVPVEEPVLPLAGTGEEAFAPVASGGHGPPVQLALTGTAQQARGTGASGTTAQSPEAFSPGETLTYDVTWSVFRAGEVSATLSAMGGSPQAAYQVTATARSAGFVSLLYDVNNVFRATFNPETMCSERIDKQVSEGRRHKRTEIDFDYTRRLAHLDERDLTRPEAPLKRADLDIPACVEDLVTAFYYVRRQRLEVGHTIEVPVNDGSKTQHVSLEVQAIEKVETPLGTFEAYRTEPKVVSPLLRRKGRMLIWFSADDRHLPLRIRALIVVGSITGTLRAIGH